MVHGTCFDRYHLNLDVCNGTIVPKFIVPNGMQVLILGSVFEVIQRLLAFASVLVCVEEGLVKAFYIPMLREWRLFLSSICFPSFLQVYTNQDIFLG